MIEDDYYGDGFGDPLFDTLSSVFPVLFVIGIVAAIATTAWRVSTARRMARDAGMSERDATIMALMTDQGMESTYLASSMRRPASAPDPAQAPPAVRSAADRLLELKSLHEAGHIDAGEYAARRQAIIDAI